MATYVIGDIHGCSRTLEALLALIEYEPGVDRLWLTGDLVNRGPDSLGVLRWAVAQGERVVCVLGNHDIQLLGAALGAPGFRVKKAWEPVLDAPDAEPLISWLRSRPILHHEAPWTLVHAGLLPSWDLEYASRMARDCEAMLEGEGAVSLLATIKAQRSGRERSPEEGLDSLAEFVQVVTMLRLVDENGQWVREWVDAPGDRPPATHAWFDAPGRRHGEQKIFFGHWATLGLLLREEVCCLDSGCVWGLSLSALRLEDGRVFQQELLDRRPERS